MGHWLKGGKKTLKNTEYQAQGVATIPWVRQNTQGRGLPHSKLWTEIQTFVERAQAWLSR